MRIRLLLTVVLFSLLLLASGTLTRGQGPTETPTPTDTATDTPTLTETATITPTFNLYWTTTLQPSGQAGAILYTVTAGEAAIFSVLLFIAVILLMLLFVVLRRGRA